MTPEIATLLVAIAMTVLAVGLGIFMEKITREQRDKDLAHLTPEQRRERDEEEWDARQY